MKFHNFPFENLFKETCGPTTGPNCEACRVIKNPLLPARNKIGNLIH